MLALKDRQLQIIAPAADRLPAEKRATFLDRIKGQLQLRGLRFTDADLDDAVRQALRGLIPPLDAAAPLPAAVVGRGTARPISCSATPTGSSLPIRRFPPPWTERCIRATDQNNRQQLARSEETSGFIPIMCCGELSEMPLIHVSFYERARRWVLAGWRNRAVSFKAVVYALVGVVNTAIDYGVFLTAHAVLGLPLVATNTLSWMVAVSVSYMLNSTLTFAAESGRKLRWLAYFTFVASGIAGWFANTAALVVAVEVLLLPVWLAKLLAVMASFIVNFSMSHFIVFRVRRSLPATT